MARLVSPADRQRLGIVTNEERMKKMIAKSERQLQSQIVQYLRLRGLEVLWHRTDKKSHATIGWPDITFSAKVGAFPMPVAIEVKFGSGTLSREQNDLLARLQASPNFWRVLVVRNFVEVVDFLREAGL